MVLAMNEIAPGLWHWTVPHDRIRIDVSSYYLAPERVLIDPMVPPEGLEWFEEHGRPEHLVMSNRHHDRHAWRLREAFGTTVHCVRNGLHEIEGRGPVEPFDFGAELPGGIVAYEIGAICPDECALHVPAHNALACADGVINEAGELSFVPEEYMDEPERTKDGLRAAYRRLLDADLDFDILLLAHGDPVVRGGRQALRRFAEG
jgi:glyoxylase-like metal-dependent hydrolase (beta-lactamase superfamily II)